MKSIWAKGFCDEMNVSMAFRTFVSSQKIVVRIAASNTYQLFNDDRFIAYGPLRSAHGYSNVSEYHIDTGKEKSYITAIVASYNINTYYTVRENPFFACEILDENGIIIASSGDFECFLIDDRVQKVPKFSFQRPFTESYIMDGCRSSFFCGQDIFKRVETEEVKGNSLLSHEIKTPQFDTFVIDNLLECGKAFFDDTNHIHQWDLYYRNDSINAIAFGKEEVEDDILSEACRIKCQKGEDKDSDYYRLYELPYNTTGFVSLDVVAFSDCRIFILFDEIVYKEITDNQEVAKNFEGTDYPLVFWRTRTINAVKWKITAGSYKLKTFEPYTMKYLKLVVFGRAKVNLSFTTYQNSAASLEFSCDNEGINRIFEAAKNTFAQNSVDVLTDCPSRERAGWLCDSYFSARAETIFTGQNAVEQNFLRCFLLAPQSPYLPKGMLPMCYPADHYNGNYIANWALWFIVELKDYFRRTGDKSLIIQFKEKVYELLECMRKFENEDGLLERVDKWVFIEWSEANKFTMDVNYPSNMLYCGALAAAAELYGDGTLSEKSLKIKQKILEQSFNGQFFVDNAVRNEGKLERTDNTTETCQYYAFYFDIADKDSHPELYNTMFNVISPGKSRELFPKLHKSNAFIGFFLRLDILAGKGRYSQLIKESADYFLYMANRTQTLWEHDRPTGSCNHGFASVAAEWILKAYTGFDHIDYDSKKVYFNQPYVNGKSMGKIPLKEGGFIDFDFYKDGENIKVPEGYKIIS